MDEVKKKIRIILREELGVSKEKIDDDTKIFSGGILDSLSSLSFIMQIEQYFGITLSPLDVSIDDIDSVNAAADLISKSLSSKASM